MLKIRYLVTTESASSQSKLKHWHLSVIIQTKPTISIPTDVVITMDIMRKIMPDNNPDKIYLGKG